MAGNRSSGRRRKPTALRVIEGGPPRDREPAAPSNMPAPPSFLTAYALEEWNSLGPVLNKMGVLTEVDIGAFAAYCAAYGCWRQAEEDFAKIAAVDDATHGAVIKTKEGNFIQNPLLGIANSARRDMVKCAGEFGLTPSSRARLETKVPAEDDDVARTYFGS